MEKAGAEKGRVVPPFVDADKEYLDFTRRRHETLRLKMSPEVLKGNYFLVIDLYSASNPVHPQGHARMVGVRSGGEQGIARRSLAAERRICGGLRRTRLPGRQVVGES